MRGRMALGQKYRCKVCLGRLSCSPQPLAAAYDSVPQSKLASFRNFALSALGLSFESGSHLGEDDMERIEDVYKRK